MIKKAKLRKRLLLSLIALVILIIIGSAGAIFLYIRDHATNDQAYPGYLPGHGTLEIVQVWWAQRACVDYWSPGGGGSSAGGGCISVTPLSLN